MTSNDYVAPSLWLDLYRSLVAATNFIYITGWSVYTDMKLLRYVLNLFVDDLFHFTMIKLKFRQFQKAIVDSLIFQKAANSGLNKYKSAELS